MDWRAKEQLLDIGVFLWGDDPELLGTCEGESGREQKEVVFVEEGGLLDGDAGLFKLSMLVL